MKNAQKRILVLGGSGGVGKSISQNLLKHTNVDVIISGRDTYKSEALVSTLKKRFPNRTVLSIYSDATEKESLIQAFKNIDLVLVTTTTPNYIGTIAEAAIETETDMIDIFVRGDVVDKLEKYRDLIIAKKRIFITQAGFHPGLPAPFIKYGKEKFDTLNTANVVMAMNALFEKPESTHEILHEIGEGNAQILVNNIWIKASYKDTLEIKFSTKFGLRKCFPLQMREIHPLQEELGISNMGVYSAGFNPFVDNVVFPLIMFLQYLKKGLGTKICAKLMHWGIKKYYNNKPGVEFKLISSGLKNKKEKNYILTAACPDAFEFTSLAVIACLKQYLSNEIRQPNLYLMGNVVDHRRIINDLKQMGVQIKEEE